MAEDTAMIPLRNALADLVKTDFPLDALLQGRKVFAGLAPKNSALAYLSIGQVLIDRADGYHNGQVGRFHKRRLTAWALSEETAEEIVTRLITLLDGQLFTIAGHTMQHAALDIVGGPTPDDLGKAYGMFCDWSVRTMSGAAV